MDEAGLSLLFQVLARRIIIVVREPPDSHSSSTSLVVILARNAAWMPPSDGDIIASQKLTTLGNATQAELDALGQLIFRLSPTTGAATIKKNARKISPWDTGDFANRGRAVTQVDSDVPALRVIHWSTTLAAVIQMKAVSRTAI
jgi:hypothetical protein